ncbi:hypothetical protein [Luteipulveratus mongoliensis]|nr:hypothetical protein [Luteipulveratus mongoliensis]
MPDEHVGSGGLDDLNDLSAHWLGDHLSKTPPLEHDQQLSLVEGRAA